MFGSGLLEFCVTLLLWLLFSEPIVSQSSLAEKMNWPDNIMDLIRYQQGPLEDYAQHADKWLANALKLLSTQAHPEQRSLKWMQVSPYEKSGELLSRTRIEGLGIPQSQSQAARWRHIPLIDRFDANTGKPVFHKVRWTLGRQETPSPDRIRLDFFKLTHGRYGKYVYLPTAIVGPVSKDGFKGFQHQEWIYLQHEYPSSFALYLRQPEEQAQRHFRQTMATAREKWLHELEPHDQVEFLSMWRSPRTLEKLSKMRPRPSVPLHSKGASTSQAIEDPNSLFSGQPEPKRPTTVITDSSRQAKTQLHLPAVVESSIAAQREPVLFNFFRQDLDHGGRDGDGSLARSQTTLLFDPDSPMVETGPSTALNL